VRAGEQHIAAAELEQPLHAAEAFRLERVRGCHRGARDQPVEGLQHRKIGERVAAARGEHRIDNQRHACVLPSDVGYHAHVFRRGEHAALEGIHLRFRQHALGLPLHEGRGERFEMLDAARVLHRDAGQHRERMAAERGEREQIGLQAGAAGGIGGCEGQD